VGWPPIGMGRLVLSRVLMASITDDPRKLFALVYLMAWDERSEAAPCCAWRARWSTYEFVRDAPLIQPCCSRPELLGFMLALRTWHRIGIWAGAGTWVLTFFCRRLRGWKRWRADGWPPLSQLAPAGEPLRSLGHATVSPGLYRQVGVCPRPLRIGPAGHGGGRFQSSLVAGHHAAFIPDRPAPKLLGTPVP